MRKFVWTIGYENAQPLAFDEVLLANRIELVVDVRAIAASRKPGFSKTKLRERLAESQIDYIHLRGLGDPKPGREAARAGDFAAFRKIFNNHLHSVEAKLDFSKLLSLVRSNRAALLCYEAEYINCHRLIIAQLLALQLNVEIEHLKIKNSEAWDIGSARNLHHSCEGLAPT